MSSGIYERKPMSEATKEKIRVRLSGRKLLKESVIKRTENRKKNGWWKDKQKTQEKRSKTLKKLYAEGKVKNDWKYMIGNKNGYKLKGYKHSPEFCEKMRLKTLEQFKNGMPKETREKLSGSMKEQYRTGKRQIVKFNTIRTGTYKYKQIKGINKPKSHWAWLEYYGYFPPKGHIIHHIDGNENNDERGNLQLLTKSQHIKLHWDLTKGRRVMFWRIKNA